MRARFVIPSSRDQRRAALAWSRPSVGNTGVHHPYEGYKGPRSFQLRGPSALPTSEAFTVVRDEALIRPFGGFRIFWRDEEVGRTLSYPDYDTCARLRQERPSRVGNARLGVWHGSGAGRTHWQDRAGERADG